MQLILDEYDNVCDMSKMVWFNNKKLMLVTFLIHSGSTFLWLNNLKETFVPNDAIPYNAS